MREAIISDTTRSVSIEKDIVDFDGIDREIWSIVIDCPVNGISVCGEYYCSREEATAAMREIFFA